MVMNVTLLMGIGYVRRQHLQTDGFADDPSSQITLCVKDITILIRIFIHDGLILVDQFSDRKVDVRRFAALEVAACPVIDIFFC